MAFDGIFLHQVTKQLQQAVGLRIVKIHQISDTEVLFSLKGHNSYQLMVSAHSLYNRIHFTKEKYPTRSSPNNFIILLRKYLESGLISSIRQAGLDRYLIFEVDNRNEIGDKIHVQLYVELMGKYANIILVQNGRIIDALKHIPPFENTIRTIQPGAKFTETAAQTNKKNPFEVEDIDCNVKLSENYIGISDLLAQEIIYRRQTQSYSEIKQEILQSDKMYITTVNDKQYFHCIALTFLKQPYQQFDLFTGLDYFYFAKEEKDRIRQLSGDLYKFTRREINKYTKKLAVLTADLQSAQQCDKYKLMGQILYANLDQVNKGNKSITLNDFDGEKITIELDEKLDGKGNAKKYFTRYRKLSTGQKYIQQQIEIAQDNLDYFTAIAQQLQISDFASSQEIRAELEKNGFLKAKVEKARKKKPTEPSYTRIDYQGCTILIGKNNLQNDYITFKKANRFDYWFHVKDASGAHVIISSSEPSEDQIRLCAALAGYFSSYRNSQSIAVDYTMVKNLKKIPNSKLGKVIMKQYKTIYIDIDQKQIEQLLTKQNGQAS
ncbi:MAG: NFACT family protein [Erysipelotrichaceae bacterium]